MLLSECSVKNAALAPWIATPEGGKLQEKIRGEVREKTEAVWPGIAESAGL